MKWVQRRRAATVRRAGRLVLCTVASLAFGEYAGRSSTAGRARQVFCRSLCRPVRVSPPRGTRPVLASQAPRPRSITLVRRNLLRLTERRRRRAATGAAPAAALPVQSAPQPITASNLRPWPNKSCGRAHGAPPASCAAPTLQLSRATTVAEA